MPDSPDLEPLFQTLVDTVPAPEYDPEAPLQAEPIVGRSREDDDAVVVLPHQREGAMDVDVDIVGGLPDGEHVGPGGVLRGGLERESHRRDPTPATRRWRSGADTPGRDAGSG